MPLPATQKVGSTAFDIPASLLVNGVNTLAVEVHQVNNTSSDLAFDAALTVGQLTPGSSISLDATTSVLSRARGSDGTWSPLQSAQFVVAGSTAPASDLRITEINYNPHDPSFAEGSAGVTDNNDFEFLELYQLKRNRGDRSDRVTVRQWNHVSRLAMTA